MNLQELFPRFSPSRMLSNQVLLIVGQELKQLISQSIEGCRVFILVCSGKINLSIDSRSYNMEENDFMDVLEGVPIHFKSCSDDLHAYCLFPNYKFARNSLKLFRPGPENYFLERTKFPILHLTEEEAHRIQQQMVLLKESLESLQHYYRNDLVQTYFRSFMLEEGNLMFSRVNAMTAGNTLIINKKDILLMNFMKLIWENAITEHGVAFYADNLCVSTKHLTRLTKEAFKQTPHEMICKEIIHHALDMLDNHEISIQQISEELNFADMASFSKFFKKHMQVSPVAYRQLHLS